MKQLLACCSNRRLWTLDCRQIFPRSNYRSPDDYNPRYGRSHSRTTAINGIVTLSPCRPLRGRTSRTWQVVSPLTLPLPTPLSRRRRNKLCELRRNSSVNFAADRINPYQLNKFLNIETESCTLIYGDTHFTKNCHTETKRTETNVCKVQKYRILFHVFSARSNFNPFHNHNVVVAFIVRANWRACKVPSLCIRSIHIARSNGTENTSGNRHWPSTKPST